VASTWRSVAAPDLPPPGTRLHLAKKALSEAIRVSDDFLVNVGNPKSLVPDASRGYAQASGSSGKAACCGGCVTLQSHGHRVLWVSPPHERSATLWLWYLSYLLYVLYLLYIVLLVRLL
jgi:hypothetical protein